MPKDTGSAAPSRWCTTCRPLTPPTPSLPALHPTTGERGGSRHSSANLSLSSPAGRVEGWEKRAGPLQRDQMRGSLLVLHAATIRLGRGRVRALAPLLGAQPLADVVEPVGLRLAARRVVV